MSCTTLHLRRFYSAKSCDRVAYFRLNVTGDFKKSVTDVVRLANFKWCNLSGNGPGFLNRRPRHDLKSLFRLLLWLHNLLMLPCLCLLTAVIFTSQFLIDVPHEPEPRRSKWRPREWVLR